MSNKNIFDNDNGDFKDNNSNSNIKPLDINKFDDDVKKLYEMALENSDYSNIVNKLLSGEKIEKDNINRKPPEYVGLDKPYPNGKPTQKKILKMLERVLSGDTFIINFEGGVRGGKDVWAIYLWTQYLMVCPEPIHLVLGKSLEHALITVLHSTGFGLLYTIPNGIFERSSDKGAQRGVFRFVDAYGRQKEIFFYGNDKENDHEKFQGFTIGSTYINEGMAQHINGLEQAKNRMASTRNHLMFITQNPKGEASPFYNEFERQFMYTIEEIEFLENIRDTYSDMFRELEKRIVNGWNVDDNGFVEVQGKFIEEYGQENYKKHFKYKTITNGQYHILSDMEKSAIKLRNQFYKKCQVPVGKNGYEFLSNGQKLELQDILYKNNLNFDSIIRTYKVENFFKEINNYAPEKGEKHKFAELSMKKVVNYERGGDNPNDVFNSIDYEYYHFTCEDNLKMDDMQRSEFKRSKGVKGTPTFDRDVLGLRRTTDGAVYDMFSTALYNPDDPKSGGNVHDFPMNYFDNKNTYRVISLDGGFNHPTGMIDCEVDLTTGTIFQMQEDLLDMKGHEEKDLEYVYERFIRLVRNRKGRRMPDFFIIDPSASAFIRFFKAKNIAVKKATNKVFSSQGKDKTFSHSTEKKDLIGIDLMQTMFSLRKFVVGQNCIKTLKEINSYESYQNEKTGKTEIVKIKDELVDCQRYQANTLIKPQMWAEESNIGKESESNGERKSKWEILNKVQEIFNDDSFGEQQTFGTRAGLFNDTGFFD